MYNRTLNLLDLSKQKSLFLFGPRSTGKSTLTKKLFPNNSIINLLKSDIFLSLAERPSLIREMVSEIAKTSNIIVIDEIQKLPILLNEVHLMIEDSNLHFILTGSSARKLKRSGINLLGGRAWQCNLFPLVSTEIPDFDLSKYLLYGGLPQVYKSSNPIEELDAYVNTFLKEEIKEESLIQNLVQFSKFLKVASLANGNQINYANIASETGIPASTVRSYFEILNDTFVGFLLEPWKKSQNRKSVATAKFYFFDIGVANFLAATEKLNRNSDEFGKAFEHFIAMELRAYLSYYRIKKQLTFWRTHNQDEVDFIIGDKIAIEVKSTTKVQAKHLVGLRKLKEENIIEYFFVVSFDEIERVTDDNIRILHWQTFLKELWSNLLSF